MLGALLVTFREGIEAFLIIGVIVGYLRKTNRAGLIRGVQVGVVLSIGAVAGRIRAAAVAWYWTRYSHRLNLGVVLKVTALFLGLFLVQLLIYGVHELAESGAIHGSQAFHDATEVFGPDGQIGHL